jgi:hypothetical protein
LIHRSLPIAVALLAANALAADDFSTPEAAVRTLYDNKLEYGVRPERKEFEAEIAEIFDPDAVVRMVIDGRGAGNVTVPRIAPIARTITRAPYRSQIQNTKRQITSLSCEEGAMHAACFVTVSMVSRDGTGDVHDYEDVITLVRDGERWRIQRATWHFIPTPEADSVYTLALQPASFATQDRGAEPSDREWPYRLPFMGEKVFAAGFDLPLPRGVAVIPAWTRQDLKINALDVSFVSPDELLPIDFVNFGNLTSEVSTVQAKFDFFLFPFLNIFFTTGQVTGTVKAPLSFRIEDVAEFAGSNICNGLFAPSACKETVSGTVRANLDHRNAAVGIAPIVGWKNFFFALPVTHSWTFLDAIEGSPVRTWVVTPRLGLSMKGKNQGRLTVFVGATYIKSGNTILNEFRFQVPEDTPIVGGEELSIFYRVSEEAIDPWNYVVGTNWDINGRLSLNVEAATGGSRDQVIGGISWRF